MTKEVLSVLGVIMKSNNRKRFSQKVNCAMGNLKGENYIEEYKMSKNVRVKLNIELSNQLLF